MTFEATANPAATGRRILVDADACPVKDEIYKVAWRLEVPVWVVSNSHLRVPAHPLITRIVVSDAFSVVSSAGVNVAPAVGHRFRTVRSVVREHFAIPK